ncbi:class I SAM-dependent methyltransferase [Sulfitobacter sp. S190]|uniref:class I SAM-dependent methyltransferase n=1 Tax=Sulfitobacter sp. S190 TaxID=2867022 RepID=UPI0021A3D125|nr:class I SAM-dependent methyltransferase [Sulfitobacter sp. S190]UWR24422.1 class I SAM-dependent methyltransferase [Sulfitobacter sp. S190]
MAVPPLRPRAELLYHYYSEFDAFGLIKAYSRTDLEPTPEVMTNFLGAMVPPRIHPPMLEKMVGKIEPIPNPGNWHADIAEWGSALQTVERASDSYCIVELGCGWGCWLLNMGVAAQSRGLKVNLVGIEGDTEHLANARDVLQMNGFSNDEVQLHHGIAAATSGQAIFPDASARKRTWGGQAIFDADADTLARAQADPDVQVLDCMTLEDLGGGAAIDLLHIDIQGAEGSYVKGNAEQMDRYVKHVLIGTHSRIIEGQLFEHFLARGWRLEMERPAITPLLDGRPVTRIDGVQFWSNPALVKQHDTKDDTRGNA